MATPRYYINFYPRSPCGERRRRERTGGPRPYFYPRSPCGERQPTIWIASSKSAISIHALLAESDPTIADACNRRSKFLSTLSLRRATCQVIPKGSQAEISIHALLAESDRPRWAGRWTTTAFLSTLSLRRATCWPLTKSTTSKFLSTLSLRRATSVPGFSQRFVRISIHALLAESDAVRRARCTTQYKISIHALLAESDITTTITICIVLKFLSTLSLRRATAKVHKTVGHFCAYETNFMGIASSC